MQALSFPFKLTEVLIIAAILWLEKEITTSKYTHTKKKKKPETNILYLFYFFGTNCLKIQLIGEVFHLKNNGSHSLKCA